MYCASDGNVCQRASGEVSRYKEGCRNSEFPNGLKNYQDMHLCNVRVKSEVRFSSLTTSHPLKITIQGSHIPSNVVIANNNLTPKIERLNLLRSVRDNVLLSRRADHRSTKGIKSKLLMSM